MQTEWNFVSEFVAFWLLSCASVYICDTNNINGKNSTEKLDWCLSIGMSQKPNVWTDVWLWRVKGLFQWPIQKSQMYIGLCSAKTLHLFLYQEIKKIRKIDHVFVAQALNIILHKDPYNLSYSSLFVMIVGSFVWDVGFIRRHLSIVFNYSEIVHGIRDHCHLSYRLCCTMYNRTCSSGFTFVVLIFLTFSLFLS